MKNFLLGVLQKIYARRDARLAAHAAVVPAAPPPPDAATLLARGEALEHAGDFDGALQVYRELLALAPTALAQVCAGNALYALRRIPEAEGHYRAAIDLDPAYAAARLNLGNVLLAQARPAEAEQAYREAARLRPGWVEALAGLGHAQDEQGRSQEAADTYREVLRLDPSHVGAAQNLYGVLLAQGQAGAAERMLAAALRTVPGDTTLRRLRAACLEQLGEHVAAIALWRELARENPDDDAIASSLLFSLNFLPGLSARELLDEHKAWGARIASRVHPASPRRDTTPGGPLRVGYVSADFRKHPVANFIAPLLAGHDRDAFETFCYSSNERDDEITGQLEALAAHWRPIRHLDDDAAAQLIEQDRIDLLVDLGGHTGGNRLGVFARRPAPVQMTWLGYLSTTGLPAMDYRICDARSDPPGAEHWQTETPLRLPDAQWCYVTPVQADPGPLPYTSRGHWTFGSFNQLPKLNEPLLKTWATLLAAVPGSRLRVGGVTDADWLERARALFAAAGVSADRITASGRVSLEQYLASYAEVDVALDSFPYTGGTTTCDALLMGVPVATVAGTRPLERSGVSLLTAVGLPDWIADSLEALPALVQRQLADPARLARLRAALPERMRASPLMDAPRFARNMEALYREAWRRGSRATG